MGKYEDIRIGDIAEHKHTITEQDIKDFISLTGDDNKIHVDKEFAESTPLKKPIAHGMLGASFISTIIGTRLPGDGALWLSQNIEFLLPVRVGDEIRVTAEVIKKIDREKIIELKTDIFNQDKQKVITGIARVKIIEKNIEEYITNESKKFLEKVALVVGATGGIGRVTCLKLADEGFNVIVHYNSNKKLAEDICNEVIKKGVKSIAVQADISVKEQVNNMFLKISRHYDSITCLVNCTTAKISPIKFAFIGWEDIKKHIDINVKGTFHLIKGVFPTMERQGYGKIIIITTQSIESTPPPELTHYIVAKQALNGFAKTLAVEFAPKGIRINMVSPGMTNTELISNLPEKAKMLAEAKTPLKRLANPDDVANAIVFLASEKSDFLTGETIRVNGGQVML